MRHYKIGSKLNKKSSHRMSIFKNMTSSLIEHESIETTLAKAKELRRYTEPLIHLSKKDNVYNRRLAFARIGNKKTILKLFEKIGPIFLKENRMGGYLRILKTRFRKGDNAPMAYIQLILN